MVVAISATVAEEYKEIGIADDKICYIPDGVDWHRFTLTADKKAIRRTLGIADTTKLLITVGRNHPKKGYKYIPDIIAHLLKLRSDFRWLLVGRDTYRIMELARKKGVEDYLITREDIGTEENNNNYEFPGRKVIELYKAADLFVFPTIIETFGMVVIEAMAAELPIVTTNAPGVRDIVKDGDTGLISDVGDTYRMAENINRLIEDTGLLKRVKANVLEESRKYDWDKITAAHLGLYARMIKDKA